MEYSTAAERKEIALQYLSKLQVNEEARTAFKEHDTVYLFDPLRLVPIEAGSYLDVKIKRIKKAHNCTVYAVTHSFLEFGECYEFLLASPYPEDWEHSLRTNGNIHSANAWVWNKDEEQYSEMGFVCLEARDGNLMRIS